VADLNLLVTDRSQLPPKRRSVRESHLRGSAARVPAGQADCTETELYGVTIVSGPSASGGVSRA